MRSIRVNSIGFLCLAFVLAFSACRKATLTSADKASNEFDQEGRDFIFPSTVYSNGKEVRVKIPPGAVTGTSYLEFYQYKLNDENSVDSFMVNGTAADINLFVSDGKKLLRPATVRIPFYFASTFTPASGYTPYRVTASDYTDLVTVLDQEENWEQITDFTYDNDSKHLVFETDQLDGIYVVAKRK